MIMSTGSLLADLCDAHANGGVAAVARVHTKVGPIELCGHCFRKNEATFIAAEYDMEVLDEAMMIRPAGATDVPA